MRKKVLFVVDEFLPVRSAPGVRISSFVNKLGDFDVCVVGGCSKGARKQKNFKLVPVPRPSESEFYKFLIFLFKVNLRAIQTAVRFRPDVSVISIPKHEILWCAPLLKLFSKKLVLDVRDASEFPDYATYFTHFFPRMVAKPLGKTVSFVNILNTKFAALISNKVTVANKRIRKAFSKKKTKVVANGVDTNLFKPTKKKRSKKLNLVYIGNFAEKDRFDWLYKVLPKLKGRVTLNLIGNGRSKNKVLAKLNKAKIPFKDHSYVAHKELPKILNSMDVGFIFRDQDINASIPVSIYEFTSMNIPTVSNAVGIMADHIKENKLGWVVSNSTDLERVLNKPHLNKFSSMHNLAVRKFSREKQALVFRDLILDLIGR